MESLDYMHGYIAGYVLAFLFVAAISFVAGYLLGQDKRG